MIEVKNQWVIHVDERVGKFCLEMWANVDEFSSRHEQPSCSQTLRLPFPRLFTSTADF